MPNDPDLNASSAALSADSAFVVHLAVAASGTPETIQGRIEHITSGRATLFASSVELIGFMQRVLLQGPEIETGR